jgi:hypothetical protein
MRLIKIYSKIRIYLNRAGKAETETRDEVCEGLDSKI